MFVECDAGVVIEMSSAIDLLYSRAGAEDRHRGAFRVEGTVLPKSTDCMHKSPGIIGGECISLGEVPRSFVRAMEFA
jgi:hypothetical protein